LAVLRNQDNLESACEMLKNGMDERGGMAYRNQMRDSRGRYGY